MKQTILLLTLCLMGVLGTTGQDRVALGRWTPMAWTSTTAFNDEIPHQVAVGAHADTLTMTCTNYEIWRTTTCWRTDTTADYIDGDATWFTAAANGHTLTIVVTANQEQQPRQFKVRCRTGNVGDIFVVTQAGSGCCCACKHEKLPDE